jgi:Cytidine and deoxycytidylate deaminase zinc-binding region
MTTLPKCAHCSIFPRSRRSLLATLAGAATALVVPLHRPTVASPGSPDDEKFMRIAIEEARQADFPYGAVIVRDGDILARGRNRGRQLDDPTAHGENRSPCAWAQFCGAILIGSCTRRRLIRSLPGRVR